MYILFFILLELYACWFWIDPYVLVFLILVYLPWYLDEKHFTGERRWPWFRRLFIWKYLSPIDYTFGSIKDLSLVNHATKRVYVMVPGDTLVSLVWGMGLHGGQLPFAERMHFVVPPLLMWIPVLRDILLWMGAITYNTKKRPLESVIFDMVHSNRSVCFCPSNFANMTIPTVVEEVEEDIETGSCTRTVPCISDEILKFALEEQIQLVPIVVHGERKRYYLFTHPFLLKRIQVFFYTWIGYPFPLFFWPKMFSHTGRPPLLHQQFGPIIECNHKFQGDIGLLKESFKSAVSALTSRELGDDILKLL